MPSTTIRNNIFKVPFGLKNGRLVSTDEVDRGSACGCTCPGCGVELEARKGTQVAHHFAHSSVTNCSYGLESALHLGAKQIIFEERRFTVPGLLETARVKDKATKLVGEGEKHLSSKLIEFTEVEMELDLGGVIADIYAKYHNRPLIIEIAVTHFCDDEKISRLEKLGVPAIELDLSDLVPPITMSELRTIVVDELARKTWLYNPKKAILQEAVQADAVVALQQSLTEEAKWAPKTDGWDSKYRNWSCAQKLDYALMRLRLTKEQIPTYLNHKTRGDRAFPCDRKVWQTAVFADCIHRKSPYIPTSLAYMAEWLTEAFEVREPYPNALKVALWDFLRNLERIGCLQHIQRQEYFITRSSIPNLNAAAAYMNSPEAKQARSAEKSRKNRIAEAWRVPLTGELVWAPTWSDRLARDAVAECERVFGHHQAWASLLRTLAPEARDYAPADLANRYAAAAGLHPERVLRALILAGFVIETYF